MTDNVIPFPTHTKADVHHHNDGGVHKHHHHDDGDDDFHGFYPGFMTELPEVEVQTPPTAQYAPISEPQRVRVVVSPPPPSTGSVIGAQVVLCTLCGLASFGLVTLLLGAM